MFMNMFEPYSVGSGSWDGVSVVPRLLCTDIATIWQGKGRSPSLLQSIFAPANKLLLH